MDGFFEKFSIYDFFNLLAAGIIFIIGLLILNIVDLNMLVEFLREDSAVEWIFYAILLGGCYLIGTLLQQVSSLAFEKKYSSSITSSILCNQHSVLNNQIKLEVHQNYAKQLFREKGIPFSGNYFLSIHSEYYFAYCSYYIQNQNKHQKTEKMRGLRGIYSLLVTCFALLLLIALLRIGYSVVCRESVIYWVILMCVFFILLLVYGYAYKENTKYWVRMVLGVYEACVDIDSRSMSKK